MQEKYLDQAIQWVKSRGFTNIRSIHDEFESPAEFSRSGDDDDSMRPAITALSTGGKNYIEIAVKAEDMQRQITKWKLLSVMAARKGGKFYLLTPRGFKRYAENIVREHNLNAVIKSI
ncbi:MAG: hypothetical protein KatS3mg030_670 [Saprospiraceae bacterium]|nr:MAG: hypothetical protein KatS3mg029_0226 [Saprospiraceae bacterium]GIV32368.1 MAG: hypothetical protein KatS3mg030_670 [Saprospiraceae bacterium]